MVVGHSLMQWLYAKNLNKTDEDSLLEKILVIGSNSFSGASFVAHALEAGSEVIGVSDPRASDVFAVSLDLGRSATTVQISSDRS